MRINKMIDRLILVIILFISISCSTQDDSNVNSIAILRNIKNMGNLNDVFVDFKYIPLETRKESLFGSIDKFMKYNGFFFILDKVRKKKIFIFDEHGKFVRTIGKIGKGPGEYVNIEDFTIDKRNGNIQILAFPSTVLTYGFNGTFLSSRKLTTNALLWSISSNNDCYVCASNHQSVLTGKEACLIFKYDLEFNLLEKKIDVLPAYIGLPPLTPNPLLYDKERISYFDSFNSQVHLNISDKESDQVIKFDFNGNEVPLEDLKDPQGFFTNQFKYSFFINALIADDILLTKFINNGKHHLSLVDLKDESFLSYKSESWLPDLLFYEDNTFYSSMSCHWITKGHKFFKAEKTNDYSTDPSSNPVILTFKFSNNCKI
ncbi:6-bladed beta-propeller [Puteibacter caeruleilacunae]|nr:6-bladed beta-propeller [Puteibacter caeruleilacunae]